MGEPLHDIDKLFRNGIESHTEYPGRDVWDKIEAGLDKESASTFKKKYYSLKRVAAVLLVLLLGVLAYEMVSRQTGKKDVAGETKENLLRKKSSTDPPQEFEKDEASLREKNSQTLTKTNDAVSMESKSDNAEGNTNEKTGDNKISEAGEQKIGLNNAQDNAITNEDNEQSLIVAENTNTIAKNNNKKKLAADINSKLDLVKKSTVTSNNEDQHKTTFVKTETNKLVLTSAEKQEPESAEKTEKYRGVVIRPGDYIKKNIVLKGISQTMLSRDVVTNNAQRLSKSIVTKKDIFGHRNKGIFISAYFLTGAAWYNIKDDKPHRAGGGNIPGNPPGSGRVENRREIERSEKNDPVVSGGIRIGYGLSSRLSLQTGLTYTKTAVEMTPKYFFAARDGNGTIKYRIDCSPGFAYVKPAATALAVTDSSRVNDIRNTISYIGIPLLAEYKLSFGKFSLSALLGGQLNLLQNGETKAVFNKGSNTESVVTSSTQGLKSSYFSALAGITGELELNRSMSVTIAPTAQLGLEPINSGASVKARQNFAGLAAGLKVKL